MINYLIRYNRRTGAVELHEYKGAAGRLAAIHERLRLERSSALDEEIVVVSADSLAELQRTHSRYFRSASQMAHGVESAS